MEQVESSFLLLLQEQVSKLTLENDMLKKTIETKNNTIHQLENYIFDQPTENHTLTSQLQLDNHVVPLHDRKKLENLLMKTGRYTHPRISRKYMDIMEDNFKMQDKHS